MATNYNKYKNSSGIHYISNSGHDENGAYHGGKASDQTGGEWELKAWYPRPWTCVLRHPDPTVRDMIANFGIDAALNNKIGYDQYERTSYWEALSKAGYKPANVKIACEADCTAGVTANVKAVGYLLGIPELQKISLGTYSGNMKANFIKAGFKALTTKKYLNGYTYLLPGDILLYEGHHAATNITRGKNAEDSGLAVIKIPANPTVTGHITVIGTWYIRLEPNKNGEAMGSVKTGDKVAWLGEEKDGWYHVLYNSIPAWLSVKAGKAEKTKTTILTVKAGNWYIRSEANSSSKSLGVVKGGETLESTGEATDGWYPVIYKGRSGYISTRAIL